MHESPSRVLIVTQYFWPENFRVNELVLELQSKGFDIEVLTSSPNYPSGKLFPDFVKNRKKYENYNGIVVHRVPQILRRSNKLSLALNYISFVINASIYSLLKLRKRKFGVILGIQLSPIFSMIPAIIYKKIFNLKLYFWVLDIWPDSLYSGGIKSSFLMKPIEKLCIYIYSSADKLFLSSKGFEPRLEEMGIDNSKMFYLPQWIESDFTQEVLLGSDEDIEVKKLFSNWKDKVIFTFTGNIGEAQDFPSILKGIKNSTSIDKVIFLIIGDGRYKKELIRCIQEEDLENNVFCLGEYPVKYMPLFYYYSTFLFLSLKNIPIFSYTLPGKVQSYMSSGKPVIAMVNGETETVISDAKCGFCVDSGDFDGFADVIDECCKIDFSLYKKMGISGKSYAYDNFQLRSLIDKILENF